MLRAIPAITLVLDFISASLFYLIRQRMHIHASVYGDPYVISDPEVDSRPMPRHARGDPDGHVPVNVSVNKRRLSQLASIAR